ncbi:MAG TPA: hypothetical protein VN762_05365 [Steroidobacteraceae bacterium]|nr:hypothetical protein [Steroidobacteraceae bacterium]
MKASVTGLLSVRVCVLALAACAFGPCTAMADDSKADSKNTYKEVKRNGAEVYCRTEPVTGSRTQKKEICLTKEQVEAERARGVNIVTGK